MSVEWADSTACRLQQITQEYKEKHPVAFFLGSGASRDCGLPVWDELCSRLLARGVQRRHRATQALSNDLAASLGEMYTRLYPEGPLALMQYARLLLGQDEFPEVLRSELYANYTESKRRSSRTLQALAWPIHNKRVSEIVTYNYDDLLEVTLRDVTKMDIVQSGADLATLDRSWHDTVMYYVHGKVPSRWQNKVSRVLVGTEGSYHDLRLRELDWRNLVQLQVLMRNLVLFIGLSFNDPNLRWLLKISYQETGRTHFAIDVIESAKSLQRRWDLLPPGIGHPTKKHGMDEDMASKLINLRAGAREQLGTEFGVKFLWIDDWSQLPDLINTIFGD